MRRRSSNRSGVPPPLIREGRITTNQAERATILRDSLLARYQPTDDLPPYTLSGSNSINWTSEITLAEVRTCTIGNGNTCPGADEISVELLKACWESIDPHAVNLFQACLYFGYHPTCFKLAEVVFIPKSGRDPSTTKGWRPIALLSCLGKGLERLIAKRVSHLAITSDILGHQQFGALPKRSATDLVSCVIHDIEEARCQGWTSAFVTLDVRGAFDAILYNRLLRRMQTQGWPDSFLRWTNSFLA
ncbi:hypothetical protein K3495_g3042 [Podosphaera aphanis]|nr:hypothetical protein K3495_g3042 [Podosphaera aphanis]